MQERVPALPFSPLQTLLLPTKHSMCDSQSRQNKSMQLLRAAGTPVEAAPSAPAAAPFTVQAGKPAPLGPSPSSASKPGVNFAVYAPHATSVWLCLFDWENKPLMEAPMQRSDGGDIWHVFVAGLPQVSCQSCVHCTLVPANRAGTSGAAGTAHCLPMTL